MRYKKISSDIIKAVKNLKKKKYTPLHEPFLDANDIKEVNKCLKKTFVSSVSKFTKDFEKKISKLTKSKYSIAVINGTAALQVAIKTLEIKKDDEILIPNLNYIASSNASIYCNAIPHYVDVETKTFGVDTDKLSKYLHKICIIKKNFSINKKTKRPIKAIIPTHVFGNSANIMEIISIAKKYKLKVIEDASECIGSYFNKKHLGTFGDIGVLSFNGNKTITTGGGGALLINDKKNYYKALSLSTIARKINSGWSYDYNEMGYNYRLPGLNSSLGISQLKKLPLILSKKRKIFLSYKNFFKYKIKIKLIDKEAKIKTNHWLNTLYIKNSNLKLRDKILETVNKAGIGIRPVWKLMHKINHLSKYPKMNIKNSIHLEKSLLSIPSSPNLYDKKI